MLDRTRQTLVWKKKRLKSSLNNDICLSLVLVIKNGEKVDDLSLMYLQKNIGQNIWSMSLYTFFDICENCIYVLRKNGGRV